MGIFSAIARELANGGMSADDIVAALERIENTHAEAMRREEEMILARPSAAAVRQRRYRENKKVEASRVTPVTQRDVTPPPFDKEKVAPKEITILPGKETTSLRSVAKKSGDPITELLTVLDETRAAAVIDHRRAIRKPLTGWAAHILAGQFAKCDDPNAAADAMVANGWQGFHPDWLQPSSRGPPGRRASPLLTAYAELMSELDDPENLNGHAKLLDKPTGNRDRTGEDVRAVPANGSEPGRPKTAAGRLS